VEAGSLTWADAVLWGVVGGAVMAFIVDAFVGRRQ